MKLLTRYGLLRQLHECIGLYSSRATGFPFAGDGPGINLGGLTASVLLSGAAVADGRRTIAAESSVKRFKSPFSRVEFADRRLEFLDAPVLPYGSGFVASFAHPGGNITGFTTNEPSVGGKWMGLLKEIAPHTVRVALLLNPATAASPQFFRSSIQDAASSLAVQVIDASFHAKDEIEGIVAAQARNPGGGLIVMPDAFFFSVPNRNLIIAPAARYGVPTIYFTRLFVEEGGLISYGADF